MEGLAWTYIDNYTIEGEVNHNQYSTYNRGKSYDKIYIYI
jgi:hypothetical protein